MREKIEFAPNQPVIVQLDWGSEGVVKPGRFGDEFQFIVNKDTGIFWAKPELQQLIRRTGAGPGDELCITKKQVGKRVEWQVERIQEEPVSPPPYQQLKQQQQQNGHGYHPTDPAAATLQRAITTSQAAPASKPATAPASIAGNPLATALR
ncbi:MAG TPA: hypothetical protein VEY08_14395, partial [Chloroflexia bacterium]|nr:hypothetical protein [Chloroflexia bacterium]